MVQHAQSLGANAVIAVRYDATDIGEGMTEVVCYGTAVIAEPARRCSAVACPSGKAFSSSDGS